MVPGLGRAEPVCHRWRSFRQQRRQESHADDHGPLHALDDLARGGNAKGEHRLMPPVMNLNPPKPLSRREALKRVIGVSVALSSLKLSSFGAVQGIGTDPDLHKKEIPWPRVLTVEEKKIVTALGDLIVPADEFGP